MKRQKKTKTMSLFPQPRSSPTPCQQSHQGDTKVFSSIAPWAIGSKAPTVLMCILYPIYPLQHPRSPSGCPAQSLASPGHGHGTGSPKLRAGAAGGEWAASDMGNHQQLWQGSGPLVRATAMGEVNLSGVSVTRPPRTKTWLWFWGAVCALWGSGYRHHAEHPPLERGWRLWLKQLPRACQ